MAKNRTVDGSVFSKASVVEFVRNTPGYGVAEVDGKLAMLGAVKTDVKIETMVLAFINDVKADNISFGIPRGESERRLAATQHASVMMQEIADRWSVSVERTYVREQMENGVVQMSWLRQAD